VALEDGDDGPAARPATLADVAREAGISVSTASRALSGRGYVGPATRARLLAAADRLGYVPNASARTLKQRKSRVIGVVVSDLRNQFYARLATGIEQTLRAADYQMVLLSDNSDGVEETAGARTFLAMRAPGVILTPVGHDATALLARHGTALVEVDRRLARVPCDAVVIDNEHAARDAVEHLLALGHRRVGLLVVDTEWTTDAGRLRGYLEAHEQADVPVDEELIVRVAPDAEDAGRRIAALLDRAAPTAIFAANNLLAEQAWRVLHERGLRLPGELSLVGFDDVPWMTLVDPPITVVAQPTVTMGQRAAALVLRRLADPACETVIETLRPSLVVRGSTGSPP
jgi:LacI family transcriptional regulator